MMFFSCPSNTVAPAKQRTPIIITSPIVRMYLKKLTQEQFRNLHVLSYNEIDSDVELQSVGMVTVE